MNEIILHDKRLLYMSALVYIQCSNYSESNRARTSEQSCSEIGNNPETTE